MRAATDGARSISEAAKECGIVTSEDSLLRTQICYVSLIVEGRIARILGEAIGVEKVVTMCLRFHRMERSNLIRLARQLEVKAIHQFIVRHRLDANRKSSLEGRDSGKSPSIQQFSGRTTVLAKRQLPVVAEHD